MNDLKENDMILYPGLNIVANDSVRYISSIVLYVFFSASVAFINNRGTKR